MKTNSLGGIDPTSTAEMKRAKEADLITLPPPPFVGTNCGNCKYSEKDGPSLMCEHPEVKMEVNKRMCCAYWDNPDCYRPWKNNGVEKLVAKAGRLVTAAYRDRAVIRFLKANGDASAAMAEGIDADELEAICRKQKTDWSSGKPVTEAQRLAACAAWSSTKKGGAGSGNFGHSGRPGEGPGGSGSGGGGGGGDKAAGMMLKQAAGLGRQAQKVFADKAQAVSVADAVGKQLESQGHTKTADQRISSSEFRRTYSNGTQVNMRSRLVAQNPNLSSLANNRSEYVLMVKR